MNSSKPTFLAIFLALALSLSINTYAQNSAPQSISSDEKSTLATIAAIDKNEILVSIIAENKKVNSDVVDFAKMMINQHGSNLAQIYEMQNQLKTGQLSSEEAENLTRQGKQELMKLSTLQGNAFAIAYANAMVKGHEAALALINEKLMKTAKTIEIKKFLTETRSVVEQHLSHAKKLQKELKAS